MPTGAIIIRDGVLVVPKGAINSSWHGSLIRFSDSEEGFSSGSSRALH